MIETICPLFESFLAVTHSTFESGGVVDRTRSAQKS